MSPLEFLQFDETLNCQNEPKCLAKKNYRINHVVTSPITVFISYVQDDLDSLQV